jgi:hypothetical protein
VTGDRRPACYPPAVPQPEVRRLGRHLAGHGSTRSIAATITVIATAGVLVAGCALFTPPTAPKPSRLSRTPEPILIPSDAPDEIPTPPGDTPNAIGFASAANGLGDLDSYRVSLTSTGLVASSSADGRVAMTATIIQTNDPAARFTMEGVDGLEGGRLEAVVIGDTAWEKEGSGPWRKSPGGAADFDAAFQPLSPIDLVSAFDGLSAGLREVGRETRNQQRSIHDHVGSSDAAATAAGLSAGSADLWVTEARGDLVAVDIDGTWDVDGAATPVTLRIDITHVNDAANAVRPPA